MRSDSRVISILLACFLALCRAEQRIVGGTEAPEGKYPYQVFLKLHSEFRCGGSILNKRYVLTAGHCVQGESPSSYEVVVGTNKFMDPSAPSYKVESFKVHEKYGRPGNIHAIHDLAVIKVASDIEFNEKVQPVELPSSGSQIKAATAAVLTGWGTLAYGGSYPERLQQIDLKISEQSQCKSKWFFSKFIVIEESMVCTDAKPRAGVCNGDSGGPLIAEGVQVGIVSFGWPCAGGYLPDVYTRVSSYVDWIAENSKV